MHPTVPPAFSPAPPRSLPALAVLYFPGFSALLPCFHRITEVKAKKDFARFSPSHRPQGQNVTKFLHLDPQQTFLRGVGPERGQSHVITESCHPLGEQHWAWQV